MSVGAAAVDGRNEEALISLPRPSVTTVGRGVGNRGPRIVLTGPLGPWRGVCPAAIVSSLAAACCYLRLNGTAKPVSVCSGAVVSAIGVDDSLSS